MRRSRFAVRGSFTFGWSNYDSTMKPYITVKTFGVYDLNRSLNFYQDGLGFPTQDIVGTEFEHWAVVLFDFQHGLKFAI